MIRLPVLSFLVLLVSVTITSCEDYPDDYECTCAHGGSIGGWEESDTTVIHPKDTTGGFSISVDNWNETETHAIPL